MCQNVGEEDFLKVDEERANTNLQKPTTQCANPAGTTWKQTKGIHEHHTALSMPWLRVILRLADLSSVFKDGLDLFSPASRFHKTTYNVTTPLTQFNLSRGLQFHRRCALPSVQLYHRHTTISPPKSRHGAGPPAEGAPTRLFYSHCWNHHQQADVCFNIKYPSTH